MIESTRAAMLREAANLTDNDRNRSYGDPVGQFEIAGEIKRLLRRQARRQLTDAEWEALDMIVTKISRSVYGLDPGRDTFVDGACYFAIYGECYLTARVENEAAADAYQLEHEEDPLPIDPWPKKDIL